jgi:hypothetical protein
LQLNVASAFNMHEWRGMRDRTEFLVRKSSGQRGLSAVLAELVAILCRPVTPEDVRSLELGDELRAVVGPLARASREAAKPPAFSAWPVASVPSLANAIADFGAQLPNAEVFYLPLPAIGIGPVRMNATRDLAHAVALAEAATEECLVSSTDGRSGMWLQYHAAEAEHGAPHPYELLVWSADWRTLAQRVLPFELAVKEA